MSPPPEPGLSSRVWLDRKMTQVSQGSGAPAMVYGILISKGYNWGDCSLRGKGYDWAIVAFATTTKSPPHDGYGWG